MTALYRTYRPLDFTQVVGQDAVVRTLRNAIETGQVRQAYLFAGPRGTGKTSMARILAKALNAEGGPSADFDPTTRIARSIADGSALDVVEMDAASQRGIDEVREIRERAMLQPVEGQWKVYIVDEAHQLTTAAWNALLKLIEEPPPHLVFVFCTTDLAKVIPTVRSRCQTFVFQRPRMQELVPALRKICDGESIDASDAALSLVARGANGSYRDAISMLDQLSSATSKYDLGAGRAPARHRRRGGRALPALRHDRRPRRRGRARARRGALRARAGPGRARRSSCSSTSGSSCSSSTSVTSRSRCRSRRRRASGCASRRTSFRSPPCCASSTCSRSSWRTSGRAPTRGSRSSWRSSR